MIEQKRKERFYGFATKALLMVMVLELFVFNFRYWQSMGNIEITDFVTNVGSAYTLLEDGSYVVGEGDNYFEFAQINAELATLYFDVEILNTQEIKPVTVRMSARDVSHEHYYSVPERQIWHLQEKSKYFTYHLYGECKSLRIKPQLEAGTVFRVNYVLNPRIPMLFSLGRVGVLWVLFLFLYLFRPASRVYTIPFLGLQKGRTIALVAFFVVHLFLLGMLVNCNPFFQKENAVNHQQYQHLAESLLKGNVYLDEEPAESLKAMENPYDFSLRNEVVYGAGESYAWDHAYFEGKYYVYFGVVPAALLYLPYYAIMGEHLRNWQAIYLGAGMMLLGIMGLISQMIRRWFPKTSIGVWYLLSELVVLGSGLIYMCKRTDLYTVPIIVGWGFGLLGVWALFCAEKEGKLSAGYLAVGSFLLALVAGCRPQLFVMVIIPLFFLRKYITSLAYLRSKEGRKCVAAFAAPMLLVAAVLMWYNAARFGLVTDFGANYNLTFNDMRNRGFNVDRLPLGFWAYLFAPLKFTMQFPFAEANYFSSNYLGVTIMEATYGGILAVNLFVWLGLLLIVFRKKVKSKEPMNVAFLSMAMGMVIICADTEMSGILMRYFSDFQLFFLFAAALAALILYYEVIAEKTKNYLHLFLLVSLLITILYQGRIFFLDTGEALEALRGDLFSQIKYQVMFWL